MSDIQNQQVAVLLINTGSPESPNIFHVARYLSVFLGNKRIITIPWLFRKMLVNLIIVPFRSFRSSGRYRVLWKKCNNNFPLTRYGVETQQLLQEKLIDHATVYLGMCFGYPSIKECIRSIVEKKFSHLIILPIFPHYASSSTGVALEMAINELKKYSFIPQLNTINSFYNHPLFIKAWAEKIAKFNPDKYDRILFSYHSLPLSHVQYDPNPAGSHATPTDNYPEACRQTSILIARQLGLPEDKYETVFQSQMSDQWVGPFLNKRIIECAGNGTKKLLIVPPSFVSDCLETTIELGIEYKQLFLQHGGEQFDLVECLNDSPVWIEMLEDVIRST